MTMMAMTTMINQCDVVMTTTMTRTLSTAYVRTNKHVPSNLPFGVLDQTFRFFRLAGASTSPSLCSIIVATITLVTVVLVVLLAKNISRRFWTFRFVQILSFNFYFLQANDADQSSRSHPLPVCCFRIFSGWKVINSTFVSLTIQLKHQANWFYLGLLVPAMPRWSDGSPCSSLFSTSSSSFYLLIISSFYLSSFISVPAMPIWSAGSPYSSLFSTSSSSTSASRLTSGSSLLRFFPRRWHCLHF